jgi:hypothetical protein
MRSPSLFTNEIGDGPLGVDGPGRSPLRPPGRCHDALGDESIEDTLAASRYEASNRAPAVRYDDLVTITHAIEVAAQVIPELPDTDLHRAPRKVATYRRLL